MKTDTRRLSAAYFLVHFSVEYVCFSLIFRYLRMPGFTAFYATLLFDMIAFLPQGLIGAWNRRCRRLNIGLIGVALMAAATLLFILEVALYPAVILLALGNAFLHEAGAIATTAVSGGKLAPGAIFVSGGSFGLILGQTWGGTALPLWPLWLALAFIAVLVTVTNPVWLREDAEYPKFDLVRREAGFEAVLIISFIVVAVRSFVGYAIPISWKKELWQAFLLFFIMGAGKAAGGILADRFGARPVGVGSTLLCIPFLLFGKDTMVVSVFGVFLFSMTMSITFGMLLSIIEDNPGLAFGVTTAGLAVGILPVFIFGSFSFVVNCILVVSLSLLCAAGLYFTLKPAKGG